MGPYGALVIDEVIGGAGNDVVLNYRESHVVALLDDGDDVYWSFSSSAENIYAGRGADVILAGRGNFRVHVGGDGFGDYFTAVPPAT